MVLIHIKLQVIDFEALHKFESEAVKIMAKYQGQILSAFETSTEKDGSATEIHLLEFPSLDLFNEYREDNYLASLHELRTQAISSTEIEISSRIKSYI